MLNGVATVTERFCLFDSTSVLVIRFIVNYSIKGSQTPTVTLKKLTEIVRSVHMQNCFAFLSMVILKLEKLVDSTGKKLLSMSLMTISLRPCETTYI